MSFLLNVITAWHIKPNTREKEKRNDRYEFVGKIDDKLNKKFVGKYYYNKQFYFGGGLYVLKK